MEEIAVKSFKHNIKDELGLHARPASVLATEAKKYSSKITVTANDKTVDLEPSMIGLMTMALKHGQEITIISKAMTRTMLMQDCRHCARKACK